MGACHEEESNRPSNKGATALGELENGTRRAAFEFDEFLEFVALALNYLSRSRALAAANTSKLSCGAGRALGSCDKPKGSSVSAEARTFRCETHRALADARRARARAGERVFGGVVKRHVGREPESGRGRTTALLLGAFLELRHRSKTQKIGLRHH